MNLAGFAKIEAVKVRKRRTFELNASMGQLGPPARSHNGASEDFNHAEPKFYWNGPYIVTF